MEYRDGLFHLNSIQEDFAGNLQESIGASATSTIVGLTTPNYLLHQEVSNSADIPLVQIAEYPLINDPILNESTFTSSDDRFAETTQAIPQYQENGSLLTSHVDAGHPQHLSDVIALQSHDNPDCNTVLHAGTASARQYTADEADSQRHEYYDSLEKVTGAAIENNRSGESGFNLEHISGRNGYSASPGSFHIADLLPLANDLADGLPVQELFPFIEDARLGTTANPQITLPRSTPAPMNGDFQDQVEIPDDMHIAFSDQRIGSFSPPILAVNMSEVENVPVNDRNELQNVQETSFLGKDGQNGQQHAVSRSQTGMEQGQMSLLMEDEFSRDSDIEPFSDNGELVLGDQTTTSDHPNGLDAKTSMDDDMTSAEKVRMVFLYPMYKQMKNYQKRYENSRRAFRRGTKDAKYYAMGRLQQDVHDNMEIAQKATVVSRQLQLEREQLEKDIAKEKRDVSRLRAILEKYAVGKGL